MENDDDNQNDGTDYEDDHDKTVEYRLDDLNNSEDESDDEEVSGPVSIEEVYEEDDSDDESVSSFFMLPIEAFREGLNIEESITNLFVMCFSFFASIILGSFFTCLMFQLLGGANQLLGSEIPQLSSIFTSIDDFFGTMEILPLILISFPFFCLSVFGTYYFAEVTLSESWGALLDQTVSQKLNRYWLMFTTLTIPSVFALLLPCIAVIKEAGILAIIGSLILEFCILSVVISVGYKILSTRAISWKSSFYGGIHATFPYTISSVVLFAIIIPKTINIDRGFLYIILATFCWAVFRSFCYHFGAQIAVNSEKSIFRAAGYDTDDHDDRRSRKEVAIICLLELTKRFSIHSFDSKKIGLHPYELSAIGKISPTFALSVIEQLCSVGLISVLNNGLGNLAMLNFNPSYLKMSDFLQRLECSDEEGHVEPLDYCTNQWFWDKYNKAITQNFESLTLQELYDRSISGTDGMKKAG